MTACGPNSLYWSNHTWTVYSPSPLHIHSSFLSALGNSHTAPLGEWRSVTGKPSTGGTGSDAMTWAGGIVFWLCETVHTLPICPWILFLLLLWSFSLCLPFLSLLFSFFPSLIHLPLDNFTHTHSFNRQLHGASTLDLHFWVLYSIPIQTSPTSISCPKINVIFPPSMLPWLSAPQPPHT